MVNQDVFAINLMVFLFFITNDNYCFTIRSKVRRFVIIEKGEIIPVQSRFLKTDWNLHPHEAV